MKWFGNLDNRLMENKQFVEEIKVGTGMTEYYYSDRHPYEVIAVKDQKHVTVRELDHKHVGDVDMDNRWELVSNKNNPSYDMVKRGKYWYFVATWTKEDVDRLVNDEDKLMLAVNGWDLKKIEEKGSQTRYTRADVSFGVAEYYYDYEF